MSPAWTRFAPAALSILLLAGCAGPAPSPALFVLDNDAAPPAQRASNPHAPTLVVSGVTLASYLTRGGIVYQTAPHRVVVAQDHRWASPLAGQLTDSLLAKLSQRLKGVNVVRPGRRPARGGTWRLQTHVATFLGHFDGKAHIAGRWSLIGPNHHEVAAHTFARRVVLDKNGYPALVASLSCGWRQVSRSIAARITAALNKH